MSRARHYLHVDEAADPSVMNLYPAGVVGGPVGAVAVYVVGMRGRPLGAATGSREVGTVELYR